MSSAREDILAKVRRTQVPDQSERENAYAAIRREYRQAGGLDREQRLRLFEDRLRDYDATVYHCTADRIAETVGKALAVRGKRRLVIPENIPKSWYLKTSTLCLATTSLMKSWMPAMES